MASIACSTRFAHKRHQPLAGPAVVAALALTLGLARPAAATVITVDSPGDDLDENGNCTLREAVEAANTDTAVDACPAGSDAEADEIALPIGTFSLSIPGGNEDDNQTGDLDVTGAVTIRGAGAFLTTIDAMHVDRAIHVLAGADVTLEDLTVTHGETPPQEIADPNDVGTNPAAIFGLAAGGGVFNEGGTLDIERCRLVDNETGDGTQFASGGDLIGLPGGSGGGVASGGGSLTISESTIAGNRTGDGAPSSAGSQFELGLGGIGGGVAAVSATLVLERSTVSGNTTGVSALSAPLAIPLGHGGGGVAGLSLASDAMTVDRSTITGNIVPDEAGSDAAGGGLLAFGTTTTLVESTVAGNQAPVGGGVAASSGSFTATGSLLSGNLAGTGPDCMSALDGDYNLVGDDADCTVGGDHSLVSPDADLAEELGNHGGLTPTLALLSGSAAIDAGPPTCAAVDQRGTARPQGDGCDIGAFELSPCGNGTVDEGEDCDDAGESASCNADCTARSCGDGIANAAAGEQCDTGKARSDTAPNACRMDCLLPSCGDTVTDFGEACDDGGDSETCDADCTPSACGDGYPNAAAGEQCDTGDALSDTAPDACRTSCLLPSCGDGVVDTGETCDDGADNSDTAADACRTSCVPASCGDGVVDSGEACDNGAANSDTAADACRTSCVAARCGDGVVDTGEQCDDGADNSDFAPGACRTTCVPARCGDAVIDPGEGCDDGNATSGDGCSASCGVEVGWDCVLALGGSACTFLADCGNGVLDEGEECEDGNDADNDGCSATCHLEDGFDCTTDADGVITSCDAITGDGLVVDDEQCDDGNPDAGDGCNDGLIEDGWACNAAEPSTCSPLAECGDGVLNAGEDCDDHNTDGGDGCSSTCDVEDGWTCDTSADPSVCQELAAPEGGDGGGDAGVPDGGLSDLGGGGGDVSAADGGGGGGSSSGCCAVAASRTAAPSSTALWAFGLLGLVWLGRRCRRTLGRPRGGSRLLLLLAVLTAGAALARPASATEIDVTTFADDLTVNDNCTLREAIQAANTNAAVDACPAGSDADVDEVVLQAGTYALSIAGANEDANQTGDLDVTGDLTLRGQGPTLTTIDAGQLDRALDVQPDATVDIQDLAVVNGLTPPPLVTVEEVTSGGVSAAFTPAAGGGVLNRGPSLTIERCRISDNATGDGGVLIPEGAPVVFPLPGGPGGGVASIAGTLTLSESTIADNTTGDGGSLDFIIPPGTGIEVLGPGGPGGGVAILAGTLVIERSTVSGNQTGVPLSAPSALSGGGGVAVISLTEAAEATIDRSTIAGNVAHVGAQGQYTTNYASGGGLASSQPVLVRESTVANNSAYSGGGISAQATLRGSIVSGNTATTTGPDCTGAITQDYNLIGDDADCPIIDASGTAGPAPHDIVGADAGLDPAGLAAHGGLTQTLALLDGSAAIDTGPPDCASPDQRGVSRPQRAACDIGAFEFSDCGNGTLDEGEQCDDGGESATCNADCTLSACGDGTLNRTAGEQCDTGEARSDTEPDACRLDCQLPSCGDAVVDSGEACDDGGDSATCNADCTPAACGDGYPNAAAGEACDDGEANSDSVPNACRTSCVLPACGDGVVDNGEACDDGEGNSDSAADACRTSCVLPSCGDGVVDTGEQCDDGADNSDSAADACRTTCVPASCGDGVVDTGEQCDDGADNSDVRPSACRTDCVSAACGDGIIDLGESCDDGGTTSGDGCSATCAVEAGWSCVYQLTGSACVFLAGCGNGVLDPGEECEDGNDADGDGCSSTCQLEDGWDCTTTEDGVIDTCDPIYGDGLVVDGEECDDGNNDAGDGCSDGLIEDGWACNAAEPSVCTPLVNCGDGVLDGGEDCDDGNTDDGDGCSRVCDVEDGWTCDTSVEPSDCQRLGPGDGEDAGPDAGGGDAGVGPDGGGSDAGGDVGGPGADAAGGPDTSAGSFDYSGGGVASCAVAVTSPLPGSASLAWLLGLLGLVWLKRSRRPARCRRAGARTSRSGPSDRGQLTPTKGSAPSRG